MSLENLKELKVILFDLGNVVIYLNESASYKAFTSLADWPLESLMKAVADSTFFNDFEKGLITPDQFRINIRTFLENEKLSDTQIDLAWNAMLIKIDFALLEQIKMLNGKIGLMVLSNTNKIHEVAFHKMLREVSDHHHLNELFDKVYLSHEIGERKPDLEAWEIILSDHKELKAQEILFLDDKQENLEAAQKAGIQTKLINNPGETLAFIEQEIIPLVG